LLIFSTLFSNIQSLWTFYHKTHKKYNCIIQLMLYLYFGSKFTVICSSLTRNALPSYISHIKKNLIGIQNINISYSITVSEECS
jgi:hypothetical protein